MTRRRTSLKHLLWRSWRFDLTPGGRVLVGAILVSGVAGSLTFMVPVYNAFLVLLGLYAVTGIVSLLLRPKVQIIGSLPEKTIAGRMFESRITVVNTSRRTGYDVSLGLFELPAGLEQPNRDVMVGRLAAAERCSIPVQILPRRRGQYDPGLLYAYTSFPFNLIRRLAGSRRTKPLTVLPDFCPLRHVELPQASRYQPGGIAYGSKVGESPEYYGSRDFRPGDSPRKIDHRSWARLANPAVKEYQEEYYCRVALVLDTYVPRSRRQPPEGFEELEAAVSMTAALAEFISRGEYIIDIFAAGPQLYTFRTGRHTAPLESILEILACVGPCRDNPFTKVSPALAEVLPSVSAVFCVLLDWGPSRRALVRRAAEAGCDTRVLVVCGEKRRPDQADPWAGPVTLVSPEDIREGRVDRL